MVEHPPRAIQCPRDRFPHLRRHATEGMHCQIGITSGTEVVYQDSARGARGASLQFEPGEHIPR